MNILFLLEERKGSSNNKIALNITDELNINNNIDIGLCFVAGETEEIEYNYRNVFRVGYFDDTLVKYRNDIDWFNASKKKRLFEFIKNPDFLFRFVRYKLFYILKLDLVARELDNYVEKNNIDAVIGVVNPYVITEFISRMKKSVPKFIIQLDPYSTNPSVPQNKIEQYVAHERCIHKKLSGIFTTQLIINDLKKNNICYFDEKVIPIEFPVIGCKKNKSIHEKKILNKEPGYIYFVHAGMFYKDIRNPKILIELFNKLPSNYILVVAGLNSDMIYDYCENENQKIINLGCLSQNESELLREEADFLISFNNTVSNMVPSKLFECIDSGKPFLNICQIDDCPTRKYVMSYDNACIIESNDIDSQIQNILDFVKKRKNIIYTSEIIEEKFKECTVTFVSKLIEKTLLELLQ